MGIKTELQNILESVNTYLDPELETQNDLIAQLKLAVGLIISFTIIDCSSATTTTTEYQAEKGMTWGEWVESDYNTDGFYVNDSSSMKPIRNATNMSAVVYENNINMAPQREDNIIESGHTYYCPEYSE